MHYLVQAEINELISSRPAGKKAIVCIKDNDSNSGAFASATGSGTIATFVNNIVNFVNSNGYDGVDIDWEQNVNVTQYANLMSRLRAAMPGKVITVASGNWSSLQSAAAASYANIDQINLMCYDMDSPSSGYSWFNDALMQNGNSAVMTCDWRVRAFTSAGVPASKIGIGIPFYGRRWNNVTQALVNGSFSQSTVLYRDLVSDGTRWQPQYQLYDSGYKANYLSIPSLNEFDSYNGTQSIQAAASWQKSAGFGGFMTFTTDFEYLAGQSGDARYPLSSTLYSSVFGGSAPPPSSGPSVSGGSPTGTLSASTTSATLSAATNVAATCRYATSGGVAYSSMPNTFAVTGGTAHSSALVGLLNGTSYNYYVRCSDSSGNVDTSDYPISFSVGSAPVTGPLSVQVTPNSGSGSSQTFTFPVYDPNGYTALTQVDAIFDTAVGQINSCWVEYAPSIGVLYLKSSDNTVWTHATIGTAAVLQNNECSINAATSSLSGSGGTLTLKLAMSFASGYSGTKSIFGFAADTTANTGWQNVGSWTMPTLALVQTPPTAQVSPATGTGSSVTFALSVSDNGGYSAVSQAVLLVGNAIGGVNSCYIDYGPGTGLLSLANDAGTGWLQATPGTATILQNSQCSVNAGTATVVSSGNTLTVNIPVTFYSTYTGAQTLYTFGADRAGLSTGWTNAGTWTVSFPGKKRGH
jgi:chitinase